MPPERANPVVMAALSGPGWNDTFARAVLHADTTIRRYIWRGSRPKFRVDNELTVGDKSASDFVLDAVERLLNGKRSYDPTKDLLSNLNSITDSLIWSEKKHSDRTRIVDRIGSGDDEDEEPDPVATAQDPNLVASEKLIQDELRSDQKRCFDQIRASFNGDKEMQEYIDALSQRIFKRADISAVTGIPVERIDELRRKVIKHAQKLFGVPNFEALQRRLTEGK